MFSKLLRLLALLILLVFALFAVITYQFFTKPLLATTTPAASSIIIKPGSSLNAIALQLSQQKLLDYPSLFVMWAKFLHADRSLRAGEYAITPELTAPQLLSNMINGKVILHKLTLVEGATFKEFRASLNQNEFLEHTTNNLTDADILKSLRSPKKSAEGLFYPETYLFTRGDSDLAILQMAYKKMQETLDFQWKARANDLPYVNSYQALIVASMIEKETAVPGDRAQVGGVIMRRLQKGMRLQIDATLYYGLHEPVGYKLTKADLQKDNLYNTYLHDALPPTPICMPSEESIYAALHPDNGNSLYYVARGDGSSEFSATYEKHKAAVAEYLLKIPSVVAVPQATQLKTNESDKDDKS